MLQNSKRRAAIRVLKGKLLAAYEYLTERDDHEHAGKVRQLAAKLVQEEFAVAFCGHFSAGKSTIINRLTGEELLPSSPIPTSANLVKVKAGEEYAKVIFKNEKPRLYLAPYDYEMVKKYCKDGDQIQELELSHAGSRLPEKTVIMDTPGIDSADDAHRIATESAIHLADLIFYVMDYNHVQSELNFMFTKELSEAGKEVYLVINQVDKHSEQEIPFASFKSSVVDSFASWGVKPAGIFYTSLKEDGHEHNQFAALQSFLAERLQKKDWLLLQSIEQSLQKIVKDHLDVKKKKNEAELQPCREILQELSAEEQAELTGKYESLLKESRELAEIAASAERDFDAEVNKIMSSAYLIRFETRALAESYLESCQSGFKAGWLFAKQKTAAVRAERLEFFYQELFEKTKSQLEWHLRDFLLRFLKERRLEKKELLDKIQSYEVAFSREILTSAVKDGARVSGATVINYTDGVASEIKRLAKVGLEGLKLEILQTLQDRNTAAQARLAQKSDGLERYLDALEELKKCETAAEVAKLQLERLLLTASEAADFSLLEPQAEECEVIVGEAGQLRTVQQKKSASLNVPVKKATPSLKAEATDRMKETALKLQETAALTKELPGFQKLAAELREKAARLEHKGFTVALFGAFSAGKSSFANALIGERVLPVSPNPTTAAINKIKPVDDANAHGTVRIKLKEKQAMLEDVNHALKFFELQAEDLQAALQKAAMLDDAVGRQGAAEKTNHAFLQAFTRGYATVGASLGTVIETTLSEFDDYVALEEKSCFVEWVELYYDCPLTRKGITLVDTPGADSINVRHTGVAFDFIRNSDAILFVTYYNHAFSKADREFLMQLGRVKDAFQLDKMFFIINAIDLANNDEEKDTVVEYVQEQLIKYGVRNPQLYPLSSLKALREKLEAEENNVSGMNSFEESFYHFIAHDLADLAVAASEKELMRVGQFMDRLIENSREDAAVKLQKRAGIEAEKAAIREIIAKQTSENLQNRLRQETKVLIYYIKQRIFLRFSEFFKESFNPGVLRDDGRNLKKVLQNALNELIEALGFEFAQEMRATTVRLDRFAGKITAEYQRTLTERIAEINQDISFSLFEGKAEAQLEFAAAFQEMTQDSFAKALAYFKNPKAFFAKHENRLMSEELQRVLDVAADEYLQREELRLDESYGEVIEESCGELLLQMLQQVDDFYLSLLSALDGGVPTERLLEIRQNLQALK